MRNKELFLHALEGLIGYPGGDPAPEIYWSLDEFRQFYEAETGHQLELPEYDEEGTWANALIEAIRNDEADRIETEETTMITSEAIDFFYSMRNVESLIESALEGEDLNVTFNREELIEWALGHSGDNDYDYELGRSGWVEIENNIEQLAQLYLNDLDGEEFGDWISEEELTNIKNSLEGIVGNNDNPENEHPDDMGPNDQGLQEELKRIKKLL